MGRASPRIVKMTARVYSRYCGRDLVPGCHHCNKIIEIGDDYVAKRIRVNRWGAYCVPCARELNIVV